MSENENGEEEVIIDSQENNEEIEVELDELADDTVVEEATEVIEEKEVEKQTETLEQKRARLKRQLEQTEKKMGIVPEKKQESPKNIEQLSTIDTIAIMKADIDTEDIPKVVEMAKLMNTTVAEALKTNAVRTILNEEKEQRRSAEATSVSSARRATSRVTDDMLIERAGKGIMPDNDADLQRLINARLAKK